MIIQKRKIKDIKPVEWNPRVISDKELKKLENSIDKFGYIEPIIINKRSDHVVGGHQRLKVLQKKMKPDEEIEVVIVDLDENQEKALNLALNRISGEWTEDKLYEVLKSLRENDREILNYTGFDDREIFKLLDKTTKAQEDEFKKLEDAKDKYQVKEGEVYQLGNHMLMCGDALKQENWDKLLQGKKADLCFTDPPYNVDLKHRGYRPEEIQGWADDYDSPVYNVFLDKMVEVIKENLKDGGVYYICQGWKFWHLNVVSILKHDDLIYHQAIVWHKMWPVMGKTDYLKDFELIIYGWKKGVKHLFMPGLAGDTDLWAVKKDNPNTYVHLTQKPVELPFKAVKNNTSEKEVVIDLFGGSGSTLIACEQADRSCRMTELNPHYVSTIIERWETFTGKKAVKLHNGQ